MKIIAIILSLVIMFLPDKQEQKKPLKYIAFGDSYTICTGTNTDSEHWPNILAKHLKDAGIPTELTFNPSRNGFSTQNLINNELPLLKTNAIDFATLLIGVNDWVRQTDAETYHKNLNYIIDEIQKKLSNKKHLILITIPDFGVTPQGAGYGSGRDISKGISEFNDIIKSEAKKRGLVCVDIFAISQQMKGNSQLVSPDGLHPSAKEYAIWESLIFPEVRKLLAN
ncbi:MAG: SGNH/GDSL hydrolase family protein [Bacteroidota bacterium]